MGMLSLRDFSGGWTPDADSVNAAPNALLRMDNCILDEAGVLSMRQGSAALNGTPFADRDIHSLYTAILNGTRYRFAGCTNAVYVNGSSLTSSINGNYDIAFGSALGQVFFARGTTKKKYDGTTLNNWGIAMTGGTPNIAAITADFKVFASCDSTETTWTDKEGTSAAAAGYDGTANGAKAVTPDTTSGRGAIDRNLGSDTDFTVLTGGAAATDDDLISVWVYVTDPASLASIAVTIAVNSSLSDLFSNDVYGRKWLNAAVANYAVTPGGARPSNVIDFPTAKNTWIQLTSRRGDFLVNGNTNQRDPSAIQSITVGKGWNTVRAVRLSCVTTAGTADVIRFDDCRISGGAISSDALTYEYVYANNTGKYVALSAPSAPSVVTGARAQSIKVTVPADGSRDSQINEIWLYRYDALLGGYFRVKVATGVSGTGSVDITDTLSDADVLTIDLPIQADNGRPPDSIIGIAGPYYDRLFTLTASTLAPSRQLNPDTFSTGQQITIAGSEETALWVRQAFGGVYVGTTKDIYRIDGTGAELPDGTVDFTKTPLNIDHPPIDAGTAQEGNVLIYISSDGWREMAGAGSVSLSGSTNLLYRGYTRHGVSPVNLTTGRFRAALNKRQLLAITPEGTDTAQSGVIYRQVTGSAGGWYRHLYSTLFRSIFREPDGTLLAGDNTGTVWIIDQASASNDGGLPIPVMIWTKASDNQQPFVEKQAASLQVLADTGGLPASIGLYLDGSGVLGSAGATVNTSGGIAMGSADLTALELFRQVQLRITGNFSTIFRLAAINLVYEGLPIGVRAWDSGPMDLGVRELVWVRELRIKARAGADLLITPSFDGIVFPAVTIQVPTSSQNVVTHFSVSMNRGYKGHVPRLVITSATEFYPFWIDVIRRVTGRMSDKPTIRVPARLGGERAA